MIEKYPLPENWRWVRLGDIIQEALPGFACGKRTITDGYIQLRMNNISSRCQIDLSSTLRVPAKQEQVEKYQLVPGDVIFNNTNSVELVGKTALFNEEKGIFLYSNHLTRLRPVPETLDSTYLASWLKLQWYRRVFEMICNRWIGQAAVQREKLLNLEIPLPPFPEQKRIASKIQELMQEVERTRMACEKQLEAARTLPAAYLRDVFESDEAKKWERKKLKEACEIFSGSSAPQEKKYFENGKYPFVRVQDLGKYGRTNNLVEIKDYVNEVAIEELKLKKAEKETILFPKSGAAITTNNRAILGFDAFIVSHLAGVKPREEVADTHFVYYWLCLTDMVQYMENPGYPSLKLSIISKVFIPLPPLEVQRRIAVELKEKMAGAGKLRTAIENQLEAINALPQAILRKAFRGEL